MSRNDERWVVQNEDLSDPWNATAWVTTADGKESIANELTPERARLIAAAPEMAELLRRLVDAPWGYDAMGHFAKAAETLLDRIAPSPGEESGE